MWFPEKNDPELERLGAIIFDLRREQFIREIRHEAQERVWETAEQESSREAWNEQKLREFDLETLRLIRGQP